MRREDLVATRNSHRQSVGRRLTQRSTGQGPLAHPPKITGSVARADIRGFCRANWLAVNWWLREGVLDLAGEH